EVAYIIADTGARLLVASSGLAVAGVGVKTLTPGELAGEPIGDFADTGADDLAYIIYTSGSSGHPKGVAHAHRAAFARRMMWRGWYGLGADDLILHAGAFNWTYTLGTGVLDPWAAGAASLIYAGPRDPSVWPRLIETFGATIFAAAPGVYRQLLKSDADLSGLTSLRHGLSAGEAMADSVERAWVERTGKPVYEALGMTECSTFLSSSPDNPGRAGHAGRPQQGRRVALLPLDGGDTPVPLGEAGVISIHRSDPGLMKGYWNLANETAEALRGDWFLTGDLGVMDADGYVRYEGRSDDQMNAQGYRVAPQEVEAALMQHPAITGAAAVALPVRDDLSLIAAFLTVDGEVPTDDDLARHCAEHLAAYKIPKIFRVLDELPHTPNGKLMRKALVRAERGKG
ncbi:MAG: AMP-binding protein, partial [Rhodospirillales bacterium]